MANGEDYQTELYRAAKDLVGKGYAPIPIGADKAPIVEWKAFQERQPDNSETWHFFMELKPKAIGIVTGRIFPVAGRDYGPDGVGWLAVLDCDDLEVGNEWAKANPTKANGPGASTPRPGRHRYFVSKEPIKSIKVTYQGLLFGDLKCCGGYVVCPPSRLNGKAYEWISGEKIPIDGWPDLEGTGLTKAVDENTAANDLAASGEPIPQGCRDDTLIRIAGRLRAEGKNEDEIFDELMAVNATRCDPPLSEKIVRKKAQSAAKYPPYYNKDDMPDMEEPEAKPKRPAKGPRELGAPIPKVEAEAIIAIAPECPNADLRRAITGVLRNLKINAATRREAGGNLLLGWLADNGEVIRSTNGNQVHYFFHDTHRLFNLDTNEWRAWLYALTGANPAGIDFRYLEADVEAAAWNLPQTRDVYKVAYWEKARQVLLVSRFNGQVFVLDGDTIEEGYNGDGVLFDDAAWWQPYTPDFDADPGAELGWCTRQLPQWDGDADIHALAYLAWFLASFFTELHPTRPILLLVGEKGSGKTMALRVLLQLLFGWGAEVSGAPPRPDAFTVAAAHNHLLVFDNMDLGRADFWMRDKLARLATGGVDRYRQLYTTNTEYIIRYRTWLACTSRDPEVFLRDDLVDRLLPLPTLLVPEEQRKPERHFLELVEAKRGAWWGNVLLLLNAMVMAIRAGELPTSSILRMADWETFGRLLARHFGMEDEWMAFTKTLQRQQSLMLLEDDLLLDALDKWLKDDMNHGREVKARELYDEWGCLLFGEHKKPSSDWPRSVRALSRKLIQLRPALGQFYRIEQWTYQGTHVWRFWPRDKGQQE